MITRLSRITARLLVWAFLVTPCLSLAASFTSTGDAVVEQDTVAGSGPSAARVAVIVKPLPVLTPAPPYTDRDRAARQPSMQELGLKVNMDLEPLRERADARGRDARLHALVGQMEHLTGDRAVAEARYQRAVDAAGKNKDTLRHVLWSRGWARLYSGDNEGALLDWRDAAKLHGGKPDWYPHTLALAYWRAGERAVALRWFEASQLAQDPKGKYGLPATGLPLIAQALLTDMIVVRDLRAEPGTPRFDGETQELVLGSHLMVTLPQYPRSAIAAKAQGRVMLRTCVDAHGKPYATSIEQSSGRSDLDRSALESVEQWQFRPKVCGGKRRSEWVWVPIQFELRGSFARPQRNEREFFRTKFGPGVGLDAAGYRVVVRECYADIVCSADAVPPQPDEKPTPQRAEL